MVFEKVIIVEWYDNIIKAFCFENGAKVFFYTLIALDTITDEKIYLGVDVDSYCDSAVIKAFLETDTLKENYKKLPRLLNNVSNETDYMVIKTMDLKTETGDPIIYKSSQIAKHKIVFSSYPEVLEKAALLDDWWVYTKTMK